MGLHDSSSHRARVACTRCSRADWNHAEYVRRYSQSGDMLPDLLSCFGTQEATGGVCLGTEESSV